MDMMPNTEPIHINPNQSKLNVCDANLTKIWACYRQYWIVLQYYPIPANPFMKYWHVLARIGKDLRGRICIGWYGQQDTRQIQTNTSQYIPNTFMTGTKPVVVMGFVLACIGHVLGMYWACIGMYWSVFRPHDDHRFCPREHGMYCMYWHVLACIGMYWACIVCAIQTSIQTNTDFDPNTNQIYLVCIEYVLDMYWVCIGMYWFGLAGISLD